MRSRQPEQDRPGHDDGPLFARVDEMRAAAPDGCDWESQVIRLACELCAPGERLRPSQLRDAAAQLGLVPHHPARWGAVWAKLRAFGFERTREEAVSDTVSRNAAREAVWARRSA